MDTLDRYANVHLALTTAVDMDNVSMEFVNVNRIGLSIGTCLHGGSDDYATGACISINDYTGINC